MTEEVDFTEYERLIIKAPYSKHKSICECILIKLDYEYNRNNDSWRSKDNKILLAFDFSGPLTVNVWYSSDSTTQICDIARPLKFLLDFINLVAPKNEVKAVVKVQD